MDCLLWAKYFTKLSLPNEYLLVCVTEDNQKKTAFYTPLGLYKFKVMPFGLANTLWPCFSSS